MSMPNKSRKGRTESAQMTNKTIKSESKSDIVKIVDKAQPTAEQMRIAQIIDTQQEDPDLKDKIRQVMDATQKSEDDVCTALHDCDNDPDRAVNLLLEGVKSEWSTSMKKKKRTPSDKNKDSTSVIYPPLPTAEDSDWDAEIQEAENISASKIIDSRSRPSRGLKGSRGQDRSWRGRENKENERNADTDRGRRGRMSNGPSRGRGGGGRGGRGFNRGRPPFRRPIETWDVHPNSHDTSSSTLEDWDNEEYTGSLADSKVFTPSSATDVLPAADNETVQPEGTITIQTVSSDEVMTPSPPKAMLTTKYGGPIKLRQSITPEEFLVQIGALSPPKVNSVSVSKPAPVIKKPGLSDHFTEAEIDTAGYLRPFKSVDRPTIKDESRQKYFPPEDVRLPRHATSKMRARIPPPSKIPSSAVEMPPDAVGSGMALLDVQFGAMDFGETSEPGQPPVSSPQRTPSPTTSEKLSSQQPISGSESLLLGDDSFSPVRSSGSTSVAHLADINSKTDDSSVSGGLYQESVYQSPQFTKTNQQASFNTSYSNSQVTSSSSGYSGGSSSTSAPNNYSSTGVGNSYSNSYPQYAGYPNYPTPTQQLAITQLQSSNSYQSGVNNQYGGNQSVYGGSSGLASTNSYTAPYQTYSNSTHNSHKPSLSSVSSSNKEFEPTSSVNINSMSQGSTINAAPSLLSSTQTTSTTKQSSMSTMSKGAVVPNVPSGVQPIVGTPYIMSQGGMSYFQHPLYSYEEVQLMSQQRIPHLPAGFYELGYQTPTTREGVQYNMSDARFARADNNTSPVQVTNMNQQSGNQAHQQPMINPTAMPHAYAYFYGGSVIPGSFQYGAPMYPVAAAGTGSGHGSTNSGVYNKGPTYTGGYSGTYEAGQGTGPDYKSGSQSKTQTPQTNNPPTSNDITMYSKSHAALSKVNSYDKQGFHCPTPPPFTLGSQNSGMGPAGGYTQQLFIPAMTPHHNTTLMHQPLHQDTNTSVSGRSQVGNQQNKVGPKTNYSSTYWPQN